MHLDTGDVVLDASSDASNASKAEQTERAFEYFGRLARLRSHALNNLSEALTATDAARIVGLSPKYFSVFFKRHTGTRFGDWLNKLRIERARDLLVKKNYSITEVALSVGFNDIRTFQRAFKKETGMTPRRFKVSVAP